MKRKEENTKTNDKCLEYLRLIVLTNVVERKAQGRKFIRLAVRKD